MRALTIVAVAAGASALACACHRPSAASPTAGAPPPPAAPSSAPEASAGPADPGRGLQGAPGAQARVPREYLVTVVAGAGEAAVREVYGSLGIVRIQAVRRDVFLVTFSEDPGLDRLEALRGSDARIRAVQPNYVYKAS